MSLEDYRSLKVEFRDSLCVMQLHRPEANNAIDARMLAECADVLDRCERGATVLVIEGLPDVFCFGADFGAIRNMYGERAGAPRESLPAASAEPLFDLWTRLISGPYVVVSHARGRTNAGGVGFIAASDIVLADEKATFALSEMLFGLIPACVMPFLIRRVGFQRAHYMTLTSRPIDALEAQAWGLVDACDSDSDRLLRKHLGWLRRLDKVAITRYKRFSSALASMVGDSKPLALGVNREVFSDLRNIENIARYVDKSLFPWESS